MMATKKELKAQLRNLMHEKKAKLKKIQEEIKAIEVLLRTKQSTPRNRKGVHIDIKKILHEKGPQTLSELTNRLVDSGQVTSNQPRTTIYYALKRKTEDFYQGKDKKWCLKSSIHKKTNSNNMEDILTELELEDFHEEENANEEEDD